MSPKRKKEKNPENIEGSLPEFASTHDEIKRAVERGAIHRGSLLSKVVASLRIDDILETIESLEYDKEEIHERKDLLNIDDAALKCLDEATPPIPYFLYFSTPELLVEHPELVMYYRNVAMLSRKVMKGISLSTDAQEDRNISPSPEIAAEFARYFNGIIGKLILETGVSSNRHLEIALSNIGDALGGIARNEVGRYACAEIMHNLISHLHKLGYLQSIHYTLNGGFNLEANEDNEKKSSKTKKTQIEEISQSTDIDEFLNRVEKERVKYKELILKNGYHLLLDRQLTWEESSGGRKSYKIGPDLVSKSVSIDMVWAGEIKGGADPAGSDEHWKTATQTLSRIKDAAKKTGRPQPKLSFLATILVERVAIEAQQWIDEEKLTSVYNLTKMAESEKELQRFLDDMTNFLGYGN